MINVFSQIILFCMAFASEEKKIIILYEKKILIVASRGLKILN
jgi:hypothetical protein